MLLFGNVFLLFLLSFLAYFWWMENVSYSRVVVFRVCNQAGALDFPFLRLFFCLKLILSVFGKV